MGPQILEYDDDESNNSMPLRTLPSQEGHDHLKRSPLASSNHLFQIDSLPEIHRNDIIQNVLNDYDEVDDDTCLLPLAIDGSDELLLESPISTASKLQILAPYTHSKYERICPPQTIFIFRLCVFLFSFLFIPIRINQLGSLQDYSMFFTNAGWFGMVLFEGVATAASYLHLSRHYQNRFRTASENFLRQISNALWFLYPPFLVFSIIIPVTYWALLREDFSEPKFTSFKIIATCLEHSLTLFVAMIELFFCESHLEYLQIIPVFSTSFAYLIWVWIYHYAFGWEWPYFFMEDWFDIAHYPFLTILSILITAVFELFLFIGVKALSTYYI